MQGDKIEFVDHDYRRTRGDLFLSLLKKIYPNPEVRHQKLAEFARRAKWLPKPSLNLDKPIDHVVRFEDKSNPLYLNCPIILAAGGNKFAEELDGFADLGFGGITVGTVTRKSRDGNPFRPRIRMLEPDRAIQNSMGLNNPGIDAIASRVDAQLGRTRRRTLSIGISVAETPGIDDEEERLNDILFTFRKAYQVADYVEVNLSCPNTGHQRVDNQLRYLDKVLGSIMRIRRSQALRKAVYGKLSPDLGEKQLHALLEMVVSHGLNGLVLFNTFPGNRTKYLPMQAKPETLLPVTEDGALGQDYGPLHGVLEDGALGGVSGRPLYVNTFRAVEYIKNRHPGLSIMASGGIDHGAKVYDLLRMGADAVQVYSVLGYRWFGPRKMQQELHDCLRGNDCDSLAKFLGKEPA